MEGAAVGAQGQEATWANGDGNHPPVGSVPKEGGAGPLWADEFRPVAAENGVFSRVALAHPQRPSRVDVPHGEDFTDLTGDKTLAVGTESTPLDKEWMHELLAFGEGRSDVER